MSATRATRATLFPKCLALLGLALRIEAIVNNTLAFSKGQKHMLSLVKCFWFEPQRTVQLILTLMAFVNNKRPIHIIYVCNFSSNNLMCCCLSVFTTYFMHKNWLRIVVNGKLNFFFAFITIAIQSSDKFWSKMLAAISLANAIGRRQFTLVFLYNSRDLYSNFVRDLSP